MGLIYFDLILGALLLTSLFINAFLLFKISNTEKHKKELSYDAQALVRDLATGPALVKIEYIDRADVLLRSPRHFS